MLLGVTIPRKHVSATFPTYEIHIAILVPEVTF